MSAMGPARKILNIFEVPNLLKILKTFDSNFATAKEKITLGSGHNALLVEHSVFPLSKDGRLG